MAKNGSLKVTKRLLFALLMICSYQLVDAQIIKSPPQGVINTVEPANILIALDITGSMSAAWGNTHRMYATTQAIKSIVNRFGSIAKFGLLRWNDGSSSNANRDDGSGPIVPISAADFSSNTAILNLLSSYKSNVTLNTRHKLYPSGRTRVDTRGMGLSNTYFKGAGNPLVNTNCDKTLILVVSDGEWSGNLSPVTVPSKEAVAAAATATSLKSQYGIVTATIGIRDTALPITDPIYIDYKKLSDAGGGGDPLFVLDQVGLENALQQKLLTFLAESFTTVAPMVMPFSGSGATVVQSTFEYQISGQWKGYLKAYDVNLTTNAASLKWEFGSNLNSVVLSDPSVRRLWTAAPNLPVASSSNWQNFSKTFTASGLRESLNPRWTSSAEDSIANQLIDFMYGYDVFNDDYNVATSKRWPLGDVYHAPPLFIDKPIATLTDNSLYAGVASYFEGQAPGAYANFVSAAQTRPKVILAGSNSGLVHAVLSDDWQNLKAGNELWAFVPPPILDKLINMSPTNVGSSGIDGKSNAIYTIDGSIVARDIFVNGAWKTYAAITFGQGARALSVIDITDTNAPSHVFSVENYYDSITATWLNRYWDADGKLSYLNGAAYNYRGLGYTTSAPIFTVAKNALGQYSFVLVMGGGDAYLPTISGGVPDTGNTTYVIDVTGKSSLGAIVRAIPAHNPVGVYANCPGVACTVPINDLHTNLEVIEGGGSSRMKGRFGHQLFIPNRNGTLQSVDLTGLSANGVSMMAAPVNNFAPGSSVTIANDRMVTVPISISSLTAFKKDGYLNLTVGTGDMTYLSVTGRSPDNRVYSFQDLESNFFSNSLIRESDLLDATSGSTVCPMPSSNKGWKLVVNNMTAKTASGTNVALQYGKIASKITQYGATTIIPIYKPRTDGQCSIGDSALILRDTACGFTKQSQAYLSSIIGGVSVVSDTLVIGISGKLGSGSEGNFKKIDNLLIGKGTFDAANGGKVNLYGTQRVR